ncbi:hypothetical protein IFM51744_09413 [Aspergillus udagawae]|nr:hypothetical protein IFM51744_09413 [Aspergillus udagawae]
MTQMRHEALGGVSISGWARRLYYEEPSLLNDDGKIMGNKLSRTRIGRKEQRYTSIDNTDDEEYLEGSPNLNYMDNNRDDAGRIGCMTSLPGFALLRWNAYNLLAAASTQRINGGVPTTTYYVYDHTGRRVRKVTESEATEGGATPRRQREPLFLGGAELKIIHSGQGSQRWMATVGDGAGDRLALIEADETSTAQLVRYQVGDDLEVDEQGRLVSYEEYTPFGSPIFTTVSRDIQARREYRFSRYRWDRETGLLACGARYYCPWLGRWTPPDPLGDVDGPNLNVYVGNDPINFHDPLGTCGSKRSKSQANVPGAANPSAGVKKSLLPIASKSKQGNLQGNKGTERVQLTNVPALRKNAIEAFGKREHDSKSYMETIWDSPPQVTRGMTHDATKAATRMQNDWQEAQMSRTDLNRAFGIMEKKLKTVGDSLWDSRTTDPKKLPAMTFRETIRRPLDVLKEENSYVGISSDKFISDQKRYQAVEKGVSGLVSFANEMLGPDGPTAQQAKALQTVMNQRDDLARLWERSILDKKLCGITPTATRCIR